MKRLLAIGTLGLLPVLGHVPAVFPLEGPSTAVSPQSADLWSESPVPYDLPALVAALAELINWPVRDWPLPRIVELPPEAFQGWTQLRPRSFFGQYDAETDRILLNLNCRSQWADQPEAYCLATLFHELVHWGQHHSGMDKVMSGKEQEQHALRYEMRYVETKLGLPDLYPPDRPNPSALPPLTRPIGLSRSPRRIPIQDAAGQRQWVWMITGAWMEAYAMKRYQGQIIYHGGHWVGVQIFEVDPSTGKRIVEAWWDAGYLPPETGLSPRVTLPVNPIYQGRWVRLQ